MVFEREIIDKGFYENLEFCYVVVNGFLEKVKFIDKFGIFYNGIIIIVNNIKLWCYFNLWL